MVCLLFSIDKLLRGAGMQCGRLWTLRRRYCSGRLLLFGVAVCLFYQTLMVARNCFKSSQYAADVRNRSVVPSAENPFGEPKITDVERFVSSLETWQRDKYESGQRRARRQRALVLMGQHVATDTEVQLYQRVLEQTGYEVSLSRYAETSALLRPRNGAKEWSILVCLSTSEKSCLRKVSYAHLLPHQMINMVPGLIEAFSDAGGRCRFTTNTHLAGFVLPMKHFACGPANGKLSVPQNSTEHDKFDNSDNGRPSVSPSTTLGLVAMVNVYVLVTSANPLTVFLHESSVVRANEGQNGHTTQLKTFLLGQLGSVASLEALGHVKQLIGQILRMAILTSQDVASLKRCLLCYQLLTFTLHFIGTLHPVIVKIDNDLSFAGLRNPGFDGQIAKELILEDTLHFLLRPQNDQTRDQIASTSETFTSMTEQYGGCKGTHGFCLSEDELLLLLQFHKQLKTPGPFELLYPSPSSGSWPWQQLMGQHHSLAETLMHGIQLSDLMLRISQYHELKKNHARSNNTVEAKTNHHQPYKKPHEDIERCVDPRLRQIYTDPPLVLTPPFSPWVREYHAEVPFDVVTVRIQPELVSQDCRVHLDEHRGPRMANYPVGLGNSRINILVVDETPQQTKPVVMTIYTVHMYREWRPSLPMFGDHMMCSFLQDCGLVVQPDQPCGLQPFPGSNIPGEPQASPRPCTSGDVPGRWVVPCLSCADNRTCDWREVAWQPDGCYHALPDRPQLRDCMADRKVLFIGDSTNRGMMYYLMERVNQSLEAWGKAHDTLLYSNLNRGRTCVSYCYHPQFWLEKSLRPTYQHALEQLLHRSKPLANSRQTVLVLGGVQWLKSHHLKTTREVLEREGLANIVVVVKSLGMGFHLPVDGIRSLSLLEIQELYRENNRIISTAKHYGYEVIDTFGITMGRYKEFLQGRCACHFHEVEKLWFSEAPVYRRMNVFQEGSDHTAAGTAGGSSPPVTGLSSRSSQLDVARGAESSASTYQVRGPVNQVYSEILLSRLCPRDKGS